MLACPGRASKALAAAYAAAAESLAAEARGHAPRHTGRMAASVTWELGRRGGALIARYGVSVPYARFTEFGTRRFAVGTVLSPRTVWPAKVRRGSVLDTAPWLTPPIARRWPDIVEALRLAVVQSLPRRI